MPLYGNKLGKSEDAKCPLVILGVDDGKEMVLSRLSIAEPGPKYFHFPLDEEGIAQRGYDTLYFKGIISEHRKKIKKNGIFREIWEPTQGVRNEPLDLRVYNLACMKSLPQGWAEQSRQMMQGIKKPIESGKCTDGKESISRAKRRRVNIW